MKVKFLQDFQGRETRNIFYLKGAEVEVETEIALQLIQDKFAVDVTPIEAEQPEPEAAEQKPTKRGKK
jgi:hypothetical protein